MKKVILRGLIETLIQLETDINSLSEIGIEKTDAMQDELREVIEVLQKELLQ